MPEIGTRPVISHSPLSVVLVACNEGADVEEVGIAWINFLDSLQRDYEVILVDDGSSDGTQAVAENLVRRFSHFKFLSHPVRRGWGAALQTGLQAARFPLLFYSTCNKQFHPGDLERLLEQIDKVELVTGYRVWRSPHFWRIWLDRLFRLLMRVFLGMIPEPGICWLGWRGFWRRWLARWFFGVRVRDPECPFRLFRRSIFDRIPIQSAGPLAQIEILAKANFLGCWMKEVPVTCLPLKKSTELLEPGSIHSLRREMCCLFRHPDFGPPVVAKSGTPAGPTDASELP